jgi:very-short-patch-repair endonuclease
MALAEAFDGHKLHPYAPPDEVLRKFAKPVDGTVFRTVFHYKDGSDKALYAHWQLPFAQPSSKQASHRELLTAYGFLGWSDVRLFKFLEYLVHPTVRQDKEQHEWISFINQAISADGFHLVETASLSGHPVFSVHHKSHGVQGKPKNLIFASTGPKPELGFNDAINNDIIILKNAKHCLIYTEHIGTGGLRWEDLIAWWANLHDQDPTADETRQTLGRRLMGALSSPAEIYFFKAYFQQFARELGQNLPALIPQVYLHYDPVSLRELQARGEGKRFLNQRMDFLMLLPENVRVVLEIDGQQHYTCTASSGDSARPSPKMYAETVRSDRQLRLTGYESYRFGGYEVRNPTAAENTVREFFYELFRHHRVLP